MRKYVILYNVRSAHNVGSVFRTADGAGVAKIYLTGYTPAPVDRFGRRQPEIEKTSLGATESVSWEARESIEAVLEELKEIGVEIVAVEQADGAVDYRDHLSNNDVAYIFGSETEGIGTDILAQVDTTIEIPMQGAKESLNVSVAAGIILFQ